MIPGMDLSKLDLVAIRVRDHDPHTLTCSTKECGATTEVNGLPWLVTSERTLRLDLDALLKILEPAGWVVGNVKREPGVLVKPGTEPKKPQILILAFCPTCRKIVEEES